MAWMAVRKLASLKLGIKEEYLKRWECLSYSIQALAVFFNDNTVAAVGKTSVRLIKQYVENCILHDLCPGTL